MSFIEPEAPLITNPFMRRRLQKGTNLMDYYEEDSSYEEQDVVQVYLRLKPCRISSNLYEVRNDKQLITTSGDERKTQQHVSKMYTFSHIFSNATQREIFDRVVKDNLKRLRDGHSFTLLTYGASGSGKTYTLMGTVASPGLIPRSLEYLFKTVNVQSQPIYKPVDDGYETLRYSSQQREKLFVETLRNISGLNKDKYKRMSCQLMDLTGSVMDLSQSQYYIWVSFIEIYNEGIYDLLAISNNKTKLIIREDANGNAYVKGATQVFVRSGEEAYDVMVAGKHNLQVAATGVHAQSSRSHCIFTITMLNEKKDGTIVTSCVRMCDLAGSERARRTRNTGARMQEARSINTSLHVLERCITSLRKKQAHANRSVVPYRESKLTRLLGAGLSGTRGEAFTMVVTLNPSPEFANETKHVLQLAAVAKNLQINTVSDYPSSLESFQDNSESMELMNLRESNGRLHFQLQQLQTRCNKLEALLKEKQASSEGMMREIVNMTKETSRQFYEPRIEALQKENKELREENEDLFKDLNEQLVKGSSQYQILMTENAALKQKLAAEEFARARAETEIQHLRACIEERDGNDEISYNENNSVTESDSEEEQSLCDESLEPTFKKEDINRSRQIRQSLLVEMDNDEIIDISDCLDDTLKDSNTSDSAFNDNVLTCKKNEAKSYEERERKINVGNLTLNKCNFFPESPEACTNSNQSGLRTIEKGTIEKSIDDFHYNINDETSGILVDETFNSVNKTNICEKKKDSLVQFEQLELEAKTCKPKNSLPGSEFGKNLPTTKQFFYSNEKKSEQVKLDHNDSVIQNVNKNYNESNMIKNILKKNLIVLHDDKIKENCEDNSETGLKENIDSDKDLQIPSPSNNLEISHVSVDLFDSPNINVKKYNSEYKETKPNDDIELQEESRFLNVEIAVSNNSSSPRIEKVEKADNIPNLSINDQIDKEIMKCNDETIDEKDKEEMRRNTTNVFLNIEQSEDEKTEAMADETAKNTTNIETAANVTVNNTIEAFDDIYKNVTLPRPTEFDLLLSGAEEKHSNIQDTSPKYNLRKKIKSTKTQHVIEKIDDTEKNKNEQEMKIEEIKPKRNLRLRHRKVEQNDNIADLQTEFCDVTMDIPAPTKVVADDSSPKQEDKENVSPILCTKSCPSKSVTQSRRKLFTPRAEPMEEEYPQTVNSGEQIQVPRPSYHRPRARRKL